MKPQELFSPVGWLQLDDAQMAMVKDKLGQQIDVIPLYDVVAVRSSDIYVPLSGLPGLSGVVIHYGPIPQPRVAQSKIIASLVKEMAAGAEQGAVFAAHSKLMARADAGADARAGVGAAPASASGSAAAHGAAAAHHLK